MWRTACGVAAAAVLFLAADSAAGLRCGGKIKVLTFSGREAVGKLTRTRFDFLEVTEKDGTVARIMADSLDAVWEGSTRALEGAAIGALAGIVAGELVRDKDSETRFTTFAMGGLGAALGTFVGFNIKTWEAVEMNWELECYEGDYAFVPGARFRLSIHL